MSLIDEAMMPCVMVDRTTQPDGEGGIITTWVEGAAFNAAITFDNSIEAKAAAVQGVTSLYTVTVPKRVKLEYHDVFKRLSDGKIFRVTSDGDDKITPERASFQFAQVSAEEWAFACRKQQQYTSFGQDSGCLRLKKIQYHRVSMSLHFRI